MMIRILLILVAMVAPAFAKPKNEKYRFALDHIPKFNFDSGAKKIHCWPDEAKDSNNGVCKDYNADAPAYYDVVDCNGKYRKLSWWLWYGSQYRCDKRAFNDWEHITINFIKDDAHGNWTQDSVTFFQFDGWYTRKYIDTAVAVYIGKARHGFYDSWCSEEECQNPCEYWGDFRDDSGDDAKHWIPWKIRDISVVTGNVADKVKDRKYFANPDLNKCFGEKTHCKSGTCGCWRNNHVFPASHSCDK